MLFQDLSRQGQLTVKLEKSHYSTKKRSCYELLGVVTAVYSGYDDMQVLLKVGEMGPGVGLLSVDTTYSGALLGLAHCWVGRFAIGSAGQYVPVRSAFKFCHSLAQWRRLIRPYLEE